MDDLPSRKRIAMVVNTLRRERSWTQAELAAKLGSQGRLSQIESGGGSFSPEQLLLILKLFNVTPALFSDDPVDQDSQLQNALARFGVRHLHESEKVLPGAGVDDVAKIVSEALSCGHPRLTTAVAPVLVSNIDRLPLTRPRVALAAWHLDPTRPAQFADNTLCYHGAPPECPAGRFLGFSCATRAIDVMRFLNDKNRVRSNLRPDFDGLAESHDPNPRTRGRSSRQLGGSER